MVQPFGFSTDDKNLRRSGLDYWPFLDLEVHKNEEKLFEKFKDRMAFFSKFATKAYYEMPIETDLLIFGQETKGLPEEFVTKYADSFYKIPMYHQGVRSLNLANSVAIVTYDLIRRRTEAAKS
jgi:tRNA (cytidine/uridine-2'-O-)-methyltransferase